MYTVFQPRSLSVCNQDYHTWNHVSIAIYAQSQKRVYKHLQLIIENLM